MATRSVVGSIAGFAGRKKKKKKPTAKQRALADSWDKLLARHGATKTKTRKKFTTLDPSKLGITQAMAMHADRSAHQYPSAAPKANLDQLTKQAPVLSEEMAERERKAKEVTHSVVIPYNKGPYMMITESSDPKTFGKK